MTIRLYFDEDAMDKYLVRALQARGVEVVTAIEAGLGERPDEDHLAYATAQGRVLYGFNVGDYYRLHAAFLSAGKTHAGIIPSAGSGQAWHGSSATQQANRCVAF